MEEYWLLGIQLVVNHTFYMVVLRFGICVSYEVMFDVCVNDVGGDVEQYWDESVGDELMLDSIKRETEKVNNLTFNA